MPYSLDEQNLIASLGGRLKSRRLHLGLSQRQMAAKSGVTQATISQIENGRIAATIVLLSRFVDVLGVTLSEMLRDVGPRPQ